MSQPDLVNLAHQGDVKAIATLINHALQPKGITAIIRLKEDCLHVMLESPQVPEQQSSVAFIRKGLMTLGAKSINSVKVYGRQAGEKSIAWTATFALGNIQISHPNPKVETVTPSVIQNLEPPKSQPSLKELAKQGDLDAITTLLNSALEHKQITAKVSQEDDGLHITLESAQVPDQQVALTLIRRQLMGLKTVSLKNAKVYGQQIGAESPAWTNTLQPKANSTEAKIQQSLQDAIGSDVSIQVTSLRNQLVITLVRSETSSFNYSKLISILKSQKLTNLSYLRSKGFTNLNLIEQINHPEKNEIRQLCELSATVFNIFIEKNIQVLRISLFIGIISTLFVTSSHFLTPVIQNSREQAQGASCKQTAISQVNAQQVSEDNSYTKSVVTGSIPSKALANCISLNVHISNNFSNQQKEVIEKAAQIMVQRVMRDRVFKCTYKYSYRGYKSLPIRNDEQTLRDALQASLGSVKTSVAPSPEQAFKGGTLYIDRLDSNQPQDERLGQAIENYFDDNGHLRIELNADYLTSGAKFNYTIQPQSWAGVIAHEILHNLGWSHPSGYQGTVISEFGQCVARNGADRLHWIRPFFYLWFLIGLVLYYAELGKSESLDRKIAKQVRVNKRKSRI